ncbi:hypothetical protein A0H81_06926 [Grifola frondosa]|uniref:Uncharacterized protein n=1 Tax=Grifola frondosa TaxID=5627 RepID=A0A1C7M9A4_GRIFR|nr:hypothetical protein A0H81_06926 [Grifola frondosa]
MGSGTAKRPPFKNELAADSSPRAPLWSSLHNPPTPKVPVCTSCHRAFNTRPGQLALCARCKASTCTICSRTCNGCPPSLPPTPAHLLAHTPNDSFPSPRRAALALHTNTANTAIAMPLATQPTIGTRRKAREAAGDDEDWASGTDENISKKTSCLVAGGRCVAIAVSSMHRDECASSGSHADLANEWLSLLPCPSQPLWRASCAATVMGAAPHSCYRLRGRPPPWASCAPDAELLRDVFHAPVLFEVLCTAEAAEMEMRHEIMRVKNL